MAKSGSTTVEVVRFLEKLRCLVHLGSRATHCLSYHERELASLFYDLGVGGPLDTPLPAVLSADELAHELQMQVPVTSSASGQVPRHLLPANSQLRPLPELSQTSLALRPLANLRHLAR